MRSRVRSDFIKKSIDKKLIDLTKTDFKGSHVTKPNFKLIKMESYFNKYDSIFAIDNTNIVCREPTIVKRF